MSVWLAAQGWARVARTELQPPAPNTVQARWAVQQWHSGAEAVLQIS